MRPFIEVDSYNCATMKLLPHLSNHFGTYINQLINFNIINNTLSSVHTTTVYCFIFVDRVTRTMLDLTCFKYPGTLQPHNFSKSFWLKNWQYCITYSLLTKLSQCNRCSMLSFACGCCTWPWLDKSATLCADDEESASWDDFKSSNLFPISSMSFFMSEKEC